MKRKNENRTIKLIDDEPWKHVDENNEVDDDDDYMWPENQ